MVSTKERDLFALRTIEVSSRVALRRAPELGPEGVERVKHRTFELLDRLEEKVVEHGADGEVLTAIESVRQTVRDHQIVTPAPGEAAGTGRVH